MCSMQGLYRPCIFISASIYGIWHYLNLTLVFCYDCWKWNLSMIIILSINLGILKNFWIPDVSFTFSKVKHSAISGNNKEISRWFWLYFVSYAFGLYQSTLVLPGQNASNNSGAWHQKSPSFSHKPDTFCHNASVIYWNCLTICTATWCKIRCAQ